MQTERVHLVELYFRRNLLLFDEYIETDRLRFRLQGSPVAEFDLIFRDEQMANLNSPHYHMTKAHATVCRSRREIGRTP